MNLLNEGTDEQKLEQEIRKYVRTVHTKKQKWF